MWMHWSESQFVLWTSHGLKFNNTGTELIITPPLPPPVSLAFLSAAHLDTGECLNPAARFSLCLDAACTLQGVSGYSRVKQEQCSLGNQTEALFPWLGRGAQEERGIMGSLTWTDISSCCSGEEEAREKYTVPALQVQRAVNSSPSHARTQGHVLFSGSSHKPVSSQL